MAILKRPRGHYGYEHAVFEYHSVTAMTVALNHYVNDGWTYEWKPVSTIGGIIVVFTRRYWVSDAA